MRVEWTSGPCPFGLSFKFQKDSSEIEYQWYSNAFEGGLVKTLFWGAK